MAVAGAQRTVTIVGADNTTGNRLNPELGRVPSGASSRNLVSEPAKVPCELGW